MVALVAGILLLMLGGVFLLPLILRPGHRLPFGSFWGVRTRKTRQSELAWVSGNRAALPFLAIAAFLCFLNAFILVALTSQSSNWIQLGGFLVALICPLGVRILANKVADQKVVSEQEIGANPLHSTL